MKYAKHVSNNSNNTKQTVIEHSPQDSIRLNKYIGNAGTYSRREADKLIEAGRVCVDNNLAETGTKVLPNQVVSIDGEPIKSNENLVYIALHKPIGITCTTDLEIQGNIASFMNFNQRIYPIGRLDKPSSGLILLTNDGDVVNKILRSHFEHEKEYIVTVNKSLQPKLIHALKNGVEIYNPVANRYQTTKKCIVEKISDKTFRIVLSEGLNRQIRRMCTTQGYKVTSLKRIRVLNINIGNLAIGEWRYLTPGELNTLNTTINLPK